MRIKPLLLTPILCLATLSSIFAALEIDSQDIGVIWNGNTIQHVGSTESAQKLLGSRWAIIAADLTGPIQSVALIPGLASASSLPGVWPNPTKSKALILDSREYYGGTPNAVSPKLVVYLGKTTTTTDVNFGVHIAKREDLPGANYALQLYTGTDDVHNGLAVLQSVTNPMPVVAGAWTPATVTTTSVPSGTHLYAGLLLTTASGPEPTQTLFSDLFVSATPSN